MRVAVLVLLAGCPTPQPATCMSDAQCGGEVCARDGECLPATAIRMVKITWTLRGMAASAATCATTPDFYLQLDGATAGDSFGYEPVPCVAGQFTIDKLPDRFVEVELGVSGGIPAIAAITAAGTASLDLAP